VQAEAGHPAILDLELGDDIVGIVPGALPAAAYVHRLALLDEAFI
jgi:hypothetical protein